MQSALLLDMVLWQWAIRSVYAHSQALEARHGRDDAPRVEGLTLRKLDVRCFCVDWKFTAELLWSKILLSEYGSH